MTSLFLFALNANSDEHVQIIDSRDFLLFIFSRFFSLCINISQSSWAKRKKKKKNSFLFRLAFFRVCVCVCSCSQSLPLQLDRIETKKHEDSQA